VTGACQLPAPRKISSRCHEVTTSWETRPQVRCAAAAEQDRRRMRDLAMRSWVAGGSEAIAAAGVEK